jgi:hypothetical protein
MDTTRHYDVDWDDDEIERGGNPPPGWYKARVVEVTPNFENGSIRLVYEIITPDEFAGRKVFDTMWDPSHAKDDQAAKRTQQRHLLVAKRIGIGPPKEECQGRGCDIVWADAEDREVFLRVTLRDSFLQPEYDGIYGVDDARVPEQVRQGHQTPLTVKALVVKDEKAQGAKARPAGPPPGGAAPAAGGARPRATTPVKPKPEDWSDL